MKDDLLQKISNIEISQREGEHLLEYQGRYFSVGRTLGEITAEIKAGRHDPEAFARSRGLGADEYQQFFAAYLRKIEEVTTPTKSQTRYILLSFNIISEALTGRVAHVWRWLFAPHLFRWAFPTVAILTLVSWWYATFQLPHTVFKSTTLDLVLFYVFFALIGLIHEIGHASASASFGKRPGPIGAGIYIVVPVFFADVTRIWALPRWQRIQVSLGGIYFQGIVNLLLLGCYWGANVLGVDPQLALSLLKVNAVVMAYSLLPFIRNDGYWVLVDFFNIPNLNERSYSYVPRLAVGKERFDWFMLAYSIGQYLFVGYLILFFAKMLNNSANQLQTEINASTLGTDLEASFWLLLKLLFGTLILLMLLQRMLSLVSTAIGTYLSSAKGSPT